MTPDEFEAQGVPLVPPVVEDAAALPPVPAPPSPAEADLAAALKEASEMTKRAHRAIERARKITGNPWVETITRAAGPEGP